MRWTNSQINYSSWIVSLLSIHSAEVVFNIHYAFFSLFMCGNAIWAMEGVLVSWEISKFPRSSLNKTKRNIQKAERNTPETYFWREIVVHIFRCLRDQVTFEEVSLHFEIKWSPRVDVDSCVCVFWLTLGIYSTAAVELFKYTACI